MADQLQSFGGLSLPSSVILPWLLPSPRWLTCTLPREGESVVQIEGSEALTLLFRPYHWAFILSAPESAPFVAFLTGWLGCAGWWALMATTGSLAGSLLMGAYSLAHPGFEESRYQIYIVYIGYTLISTFLNIYAVRVLPHLNKAAIIWQAEVSTELGDTLLTFRRPQVSLRRSRDHNHLSILLLGQLPVW